MIIMKFYSVDWTDWVSILSWVAHYIRTGKPPAYTHVGFVMNGYEYMLSYEGVHKFKEYQTEYTLEHQYLVFNEQLVEHTFNVYSLARIKITWLDAIKFLLGRRVWANTCVTFAMLTLGYPPANITVDEFYTLCYVSESNAREIATET